MNFDPTRDFSRFRVIGWHGPAGRRWRVRDRQTGENVATHPDYLQAQADAARRNLNAYEERTCHA